MSPSASQSSQEACEEAAGLGKEARGQPWLSFLRLCLLCLHREESRRSPSRLGWPAREPQICWPAREPLKSANSVFSVLGLQV